MVLWASPLAEHPRALGAGDGDHPVDQAVAEAQHRPEAGKYRHVWRSKPRL